MRNDVRFYAASRMARLFIRSTFLQIALECRLLLRLRWTLLLPLAAGGWSFLSLAAAPDASVPPDYFSTAADAHAIIQSLTSLIPALLGVLLMRRDLMSGSFDWSFGAPIPNVLLVMAKFIAGVLYMLLFVLCIIAGDLSAAVRLDANWSTMQQETVWLLFQYGMAYAITLALGIALGALLPTRFALPIAFLGWVFGSFFLQVFAVAASNWYWLKAFMLTHLLTNSATYSNEGWTPSLHWPEFGTIALFVAAFGLFLLLTASAAVSRVRPVVRHKLPVLAAAAALLLSLAAAIPYALLWNNRYEEMAVVRQASPTYGEMKQQADYVFQIRSMTIHAEKLRNDTLRAEAVAVVPLKDGKPLPAKPDAAQIAQAEPGRLGFLLHPALQVESVDWNGRPADWNREGDHVFVTIPEGAAGSGDAAIGFRYTGRINDWARSNNAEGYWGFIQGRSVYLPATVGWYPLPGGDSLFYTGFSSSKGPADYVNRQDATRGTSAGFDVTLKGFEGPLFATLPEASPIGADSASSSSIRRFAGQLAESVDIIGGRFVKVTAPGIAASVVTTDSGVQRGEHLLNDLKQIQDYYASWLPAMKHSLDQIWATPVYSVTPGTGRSGDVVINRTLLLSRTSSSASYEAGLRMAANQLLFGDLDMDWSRSSSRDEPDIRPEVRSAIRLLHDMERPEETPLAAGSMESKEWKTMEQMIKSEAEAGHMASIKRVLNWMWLKGVYGPDSPFGQKLPAITWNDWTQAWSEEMKR